MDVAASAITIRINALSAARFSDILPPAGCSTKYEQATARLAWIGLASLAGVRKRRGRLPVGATKWAVAIGQRSR
jgi:hypothetical protein